MSTSALYTSSILIDAVIDALKAFLQPFVGASTPIVRAQQNRVAPPTVPGQPDPLAFVSLRDLMQMDLETPAMNQSLDPTIQQATVSTPTQITIQIDFFGVSSGDWIRAVKAVYRSCYAPDQFPDGIKPLYCDDGHQIPLVTGEEQYENRWALTAQLQYNPLIIVPQQSATVLETSISEAFS